MRRVDLRLLLDFHLLQLGTERLAEAVERIFGLPDIDHPETVGALSRKDDRPRRPEVGSSPTSEAATCMRSPSQAAVLMTIPRGSRHGRATPDGERDLGDLAAHFSPRSLKAIELAGCPGWRPGARTQDPGTGTPQATDE